MRSSDATPRHLPGLTLRAARPGDAESLSVLAVQVWLHTYAAQGVTATMASYLLREFSPTPILRGSSETIKSSVARTPSWGRHTGRPRRSLTLQREKAQRSASPFAAAWAATAGLRRGACPNVRLKAARNVPSDA